MVFMSNLGWPSTKAASCVADHNIKKRARYSIGGKKSTHKFLERMLQGVGEFLFLPGRRADDQRHRSSGGRNARVFQFLSVRGERCLTLGMSSM